jgi:hypothetical protein
MVWGPFFPLDHPVFVLIVTFNLVNMTPLRFKLLVAFYISAVCCSTCLSAQTATSAGTDTNAIKAEMESAIHQVEKIVNQTVPAYRVTEGMHYSVYKPGWFHEGATKPDFNHVDVRTTRETSNYEQNEYVTSDLNPGLVWRGRDLEFNPMTKYFYTNRTFPKKKLTEAEMLEINRLYRTIGKCESQLYPAPKPDANSDSASDTSGAPEKRRRLLNPYIGAPAIILLGLLLIAIYKRRS